MKKGYYSIWTWILTLLTVVLIFFFTPTFSYAESGSTKEANDSDKLCEGYANNRQYNEDDAVNLKSVKKLIERWLPCEQATQFSLEALDPSEFDQETFEIKPGPGRNITISGSSTSALIMGWNWYLKYVANMNISLNGEQLHLQKELPMPKKTIQRTANVENRFALNDTDEGYTDPYEDWDYWKRKIDVLAIHGINEVLVYPGTEAVFQKTFEDFGYSASEMRDWIPTPAHQPWWLLQNLSGFPSPIPQNVIDKRAELGKKIANRLRELGMTPVFPGYHGIVPFHFKEKNPEANIIPQGTYHRFTQPDWLDPTNKLFPKVAKTFYKNQSELFGDSTMYKMDLLHEGGLAGNVDIGDASKAVQQALEEAHPKATWAILGWQSNPLPETINAINKEKVLVLDGLSERSSAKNREADWDQTPYAFGTIWNFGGHTNMGANLTVWNEKYYKWLRKADSKLKGTALMPEGINNNPAAMEFFTELAWHDSPIDMDEWFTQYANARYGGIDKHAQTAWKTISQTVYDLPANNSSEKATEMYSLEPSLTAATTGIHYQDNLHYDKAKFEEALTEMLKVDPKLRDNSAYHFDLMDITRQFLANKGRNLFPKIKSAFMNGDREKFNELTAKWLHYMKLTDKVIATNEHSLLGPWLEKAKNWATNDEERKLLEYDARAIISIWGTPGLDDYARRQWSGLVGDYYYSRWETYFKSLDETLKTGKKSPSIDWYEFGQEWANQTNHYPTKTTGNIFKIAKDVHKAFYEQPEGNINVTSSKKIINKKDKKTIITAVFTNENGIAESENLRLKLNVPKGFKVNAQTPESAQKIMPGATFSAKWEVTAPDDISELTTAIFAVDASFESGNRTEKESGNTRVMVENSVEKPYKTISFNDATFSQSGDHFAIYGAGNDMWKSKNYYGAIYKEKALGSEDTVTTRVVHQDRTGPYARAGIVVRNDLTDQNKSAGYINFAVTPDHGCMLSWDSNGDGQLNSKKNVTSCHGAQYLKLSRNGSLYTASSSVDGNYWDDLATVYVPGSDKNVDAGVFMTAANGSGNSAGLAQFEGFSIEPQQLVLDLPQRKLPAGVPVNVTAVFHNVNNQTVKDLAATINAPDDWKVEPVTPTKGIEVGPNKKTKVTWNVTVPKDAKPDDFTLRGIATYQLDGKKHTVENTLPVETISTVEKLSDAFNNIGITNDDNPTPGNLDGGNSFSAQALAKEGLTPGATVKHDGVSFKWPDVSAGTPDNVAGQAAIRTLTVGNQLSFIGAGVHNQSGTGAVIYSDGSVQEFSVQFDNYASPVPSGDRVVARFDYRNTPSGPANFGHNYQVLYDAVTLDANKIVSTVILPDNDQIHIFSTAFVTTNANDLKALVESMGEKGEITNDDAVHKLNTHLKVVAHYEKIDAADKVVKHMNGFKQLIEQQKKNNLISGSAYQRLKSDSNYIIQKWQ